MRSANSATAGGNGGILTLGTLNLGNDSDSDDNDGSVGQGIVGKQNKNNKIYAGEKGIVIYTITEKDPW